jgi:nucleotide-binding universal stress UspA family protein
MRRARLDHGPLQDGTIEIRRILWACDFSTCSVDALRWALPIAQAYQSEITAVHVIPTTVPPRAMLSFTNPALLQPHLQRDVSAALDRYVAPAIAASVPSRTTVREGRAVSEILAVAETASADLIVMGTHGRGAFERSVIGSVAEAVLGRARCPVVTVPGRAVPGSDAGMPETVLWATDFSSPATAALRYALSVAGKGGADLVLVHAVERDGLGDERARVREGERRLRKIVTGDQPPGADVERVVAVGGAAKAIVRIARESRAGLIVMGTHGSRTSHSILCGSTARRVVRDAPCPVLSVRG